MHIRDYKYTAEDVDCRYCTEFRHGRCRAIKCPWLNERIEAGVISYHDAVNESFSSRSPPVEAYPTGSDILQQVFLERR